MNLNKAALALVTVGAFLLPVAVSAQPAPSYAAQDEQQIHGTVASLDGKYTVYVRDDRGYVDTVQLHDGTIINPTGISLEPGQPVTIFGRPDGKAFVANEIDTPNNDDGGSYGYDAGPDPGYVTPYPYYSYYPAYALSYPAFISLGFGYGGGYYGGGYYGGGYYGRGGYYGHGYNGRGYNGYRTSFGAGYSNGGYRGSYNNGYRGSYNSGYRGGYSSGYRGSAGRASSGGFARGGGGGGSHGSGGGRAPLTSRLAREKRQTSHRKVRRFSCPRVRLAAKFAIPPTVPEIDAESDEEPDEIGGDRLER